MTTELIAALEPRAQLIAEILGARIPDNAAWNDYTRDEPLVGLLTHANEIEWRRHNSSSAAVMTFGFLNVSGINAQQNGVDKVIASDVIERRESSFDLEKPIHYSEVLSHTFSHTETAEEAAKRAWEVAAKAEFSAKYGGIGGSLEASAKYDDELSNRASESGTTSDTVTKTIEVDGPVKIRFVAERSTDMIQRTYDAAPDLDFKLYWRDPVAGPWEWASYRDVFIAVCRGESPVNTDYSIFASSSPSHDIFEAKPVRSDDIMLLEKPLAEPVRFNAEHQVVNRQSIEAL